jgi:hypothetical protein
MLQRPKKWVDEFRSRIVTGTNRAGRSIIKTRGRTERQVRPEGAPRWCRWQPGVWRRMGRQRAGHHREPACPALGYTEQKIFSDKTEKEEEKLRLIPVISHITVGQK